MNTLMLRIEACSKRKLYHLSFLDSSFVLKSSIPAFRPVYLLFETTEAKIVSCWLMI